MRLHSKGKGNMIKHRVVVIGAGAVGVSCAAWLARKGCDVTVVDERNPGEGCSFGNAGNVSPSSVVPFGMPDSLFKVLGWLFDPLGPLTIRPAAFPRLIPWFLRWIKASRVEDAIKVSRAMRVLHAPSYALFQELAAPAGLADLLECKGQIRVSTRAGGAHGSELARLMREAAGVHSRALTPDMLRQMEPSLAPIYRDILFFPDIGICRDPFGMVHGMADYLRRNGVRFVRARVTGFETGPSGPVAALGQGERWPFDRAVIAAGAWSAGLTGQLGVKIPLTPERGYHVTLTDPGLMPTATIANNDHTFIATPMTMGLRLAGTAEFAPIDDPPDWNRARILLKHGKTMFPGLRTEKFTEWMGSRPTIADGLPVLDRAPGHPSVVLAFGNGHFGLMASPMMGKLASALVLDESAGVDMAPYGAARF